MTGTSAEQAQAELTTICRSLREQFPVEYARKEAVKATALHEVLVGDHRQSMLVLLGAVFVVLATALANLFSLALVRANARGGELITRVAIGASRWHLARQLTVETLVLAVIGAALGSPWRRKPLPRSGCGRRRRCLGLARSASTWTVVLFAIGVTTVVTALLTIAPLVAVARTRAGDVLRSSRGSIGDRWNQRIRHALVISEISAALVLLLATHGPGAKPAAAERGAARLRSERRVSGACPCRPPIDRPTTSRASTIGWPNGWPRRLASSASA